MIASERRRYILQGLNKKGILSIKETAKELGISEITVRRDFEKLENEGKLTRVQGGAALESVEDGAELTMSKKKLLNIQEKKRIAEYASKLVRDSDCVFLDGGTTMLPLAEALSGMRVTIVTYNALTLNKFIASAAEVIMLGGKYLPSYNMSVGPFAQDMLRQFSFDAAFLGCAGVSLERRTVYTAETETLMMKRIAMENSVKSYLLVDSSKFAKRGYFKLSGFSEFEAVICDSFEPECAVPDNLVLI